VKAAVNWLFVMVTVTTERNESRSAFMVVVFYFCFYVDFAIVSYALHAVAFEFCKFCCEQARERLLTTFDGVPVVFGVIETSF